MYLHMYAPGGSPPAVRGPYRLLCYMAYNLKYVGSVSVRIALQLPTKRCSSFSCCIP